ncbi:hypothetical protein PMI16_04483 [Herbaspirillum sp. CF444]|uniref:hypothetical protein n=1 Tax=Herbaspirillum sp. CF444 TaxID=1144319 RepID=UPI0002726EF0|nr:hypothetical protein [Herbaspirillum sp. CF444]EJL82290.1 hypothetical protein PMI16_04483 [Herbaspirillum sp. CF444]
MTYVLPKYFNDITYAAINLLGGGFQDWEAAQNKIQIRTPIFCGPEKSASFLAYKKEPHQA